MGIISSYRALYKVLGIPLFKMSKAEAGYRSSIGLFWRRDGLQIAHTCQAWTNSSLVQSLLGRRSVRLFHHDFEFPFLAELASHFLNLIPLFFTRCLRNYLCSLPHFLHPKDTSRTRGCIGRGSEAAHLTRHIPAST
jgi:hypothetical protein